MLSWLSLSWRPTDSRKSESAADYQQSIRVHLGTLQHAVGAKIRAISNQHAAQATAAVAAAIGRVKAQSRNKGGNSDNKSDNKSNNKNKKNENARFSSPKKVGRLFWLFFFSSSSPFSSCGHDVLHDVLELTIRGGDPVMTTTVASLLSSPGTRDYRSGRSLRKGLSGL